ncbi:MAG TPA: four-helix bundle copper-binding protein [Chryseosolibacter sp.]
MSHERFQTCIDACLQCAAECDHCASECLREDDVTMMARCIELDRECAQACYASARLMGIGGEHAAAFCAACAEICDACARECEKHSNEHCKRCAEVCHACAEECRNMTEQHA